MDSMQNIPALTSTDSSTPSVSGDRSRLRAEPVRATIVRLRDRIAYRFPGSGLHQIGEELIQLADTTEAHLERARRPLWWLRGIVVAAVAALIAVVVWTAILLARVAVGATGSLPELMQATDAAINELIFLCIIIAFLVSVETRLKRRRSLALLHRLRGVVHVVDMHQLTKDPEFSLRKGCETPPSPARTLTRFQLRRYLDYCSEMLALTSKLAALHMQHSQDPVVLTAVNEIETVVTGLSSKIWQKIMILQMGEDENEDREGA